MNGDELKKIKERLDKLESYFKKNGMPVEVASVIRDTIIPYDAPGSASTTTVVTSVNFGAQTVTTANLPTISGTFSRFGRVFFREKEFNTPLYEIT
jgi:hypothetical protein